MDLAGDAKGMRGFGIYDYALYPREFVSYRWYKPLLVALLGAVFYLVFAGTLMFATAMWAGDFGYFDTLSVGYDDMNVYTGPGALLGLGGIAAMLPAIALASAIVRDRPFSSYSSSRGGWDRRSFISCLVVAVAVTVVGTFAGFILNPVINLAPSKFTVVGLVLCVTLVPLQCLAEEFLFRGFLLQTVASWTKSPAFGIVVSAALFAVGHPYNDIGVIAIFCNGLIWGFLSWKTHGLEASCALHVANNMIAFLADGFGYGGVSSTVSVEFLVVSLIIDVVFAAATILLGN